MREWFDFLQPSYGLIEARFLRSGSVHQSYTMNADQLVKDITDRDAAGWDCYVGVLPRKRTSGKAEDVWSVKDGAAVKVFNASPGFVTKESEPKKK